jgi:hypothetical protein
LTWPHKRLSWSGAMNKIDLSKHYRKIVTLTESCVPWIEAYQVTNRDNPDRGGYLDPAIGYTDPNGWGSGTIFSTLISLYLCPDSRYYRNENLLERAEMAVDHILSWMNEDGTLNQIDSNFGDGTSSAFAVEKLFPIYKLMETSGYSELGSCQEKTLKLLLRLGEGVLSGGFHTPTIGGSWRQPAPGSTAFPEMTGMPMRPGSILTRVLIRTLTEGIRNAPWGAMTLWWTGRCSPLQIFWIVPILWKWWRRIYSFSPPFWSRTALSLRGNSFRQDRLSRVYPSEILRHYPGNNSAYRTGRTVPISRVFPLSPSRKKLPIPAG